MDGPITLLLATFLIWFLYLGLVVLWEIDGKIKKEQVIHALFASLISWITAFVIKNLIPTLRPFAVNGGETDVLFRPNDGAFPSAHTALAFAVAVTIFLHDKKIGTIYLILAFAIGASRVFANVHWPIDIVGGALIGTLTAVVLEKNHLFKFLTSKRNK